jgi:hypothetical protein
VPLGGYHPLLSPPAIYFSAPEYPPEVFWDQDKLLKPAGCIFNILLRRQAMEIV